MLFVGTNERFLRTMKFTLVFDRYTYEKLQENGERYGIA